MRLKQEKATFHESNSPPSIRVAVEADGAGLARLLFHSPQVGRMLLGQERAHDFFARRRPYARAVTFISEGPGGEPLGTCSAALKVVRLAGREVPVVFSFDLAVSGAVRRMGLASLLLGAVESWARQQEAALLYCHIMEGNTASLRTLSAAGYQVVGALDALMYPVFGKQPGPPASAHAVEDWAGAARLLDSSLGSYNMVRPLEGEGLRALWTSLDGWRAEDVWSTGRSLLGLWDYSRVARAIPLRLPVELRALSAVSRVARGLGLAFPVLPSLGQPLGFGILLGGVGEPEELRGLLRAALGRARERGLETVLFYKDRRVQLGWTGAAFHTRGQYLLLARPLRPEGLEWLREHPVWVDPMDL